MDKIPSGLGYMIDSLFRRQERKKGLDKGEMTLLEIEKLSKERKRLRRNYRSLWGGGRMRAKARGPLPGLNKGRLRQRLSGATVMAKPRRYSIRNRAGEILRKFSV